MEKQKRISLIIGLCFIILGGTELILCFFGPAALDVKSTCYIFPLYSNGLSETENQELYSDLTKVFARSHKFILIQTATAEKRLLDKNKNLEEYTKRRSNERFAEAAQLIGSEKFINGYFIKDANGYELFLNLFLAKTGESIRTVKTRLTSINEVVQKAPMWIKTLEGEKKQYSIQDIMYFGLLGFYIITGMIFLLPVIAGLRKPGLYPLEKFKKTLYIQIPEILFTLTLLLFLFSFLFALNANMDYVQKFMATGGNISLAQNTTIERANSIIRYLPLLILTGFCIVWFKIKRNTFQLVYTISSNPFCLWALPLTLLSGLLSSASMPGFLNIEGFPILGFIALVPLFLVIEYNKTATAIGYGIIFGLFKTLFVNFWLGTFSLVSLQLVLVIFIFNYAVLMVPAVLIYKRIKKLKYLVFPLAWTAFEWFHSQGFAGYPWGITGTALYNWIALIQVAAVTGVWGLTFILVLSNSVLSYSLQWLMEQKRKKALVPVIIFLSVFLICCVSGAFYLSSIEKENKQAVKHVRAALIQDSIDPRKHNSQDVFNGLKELTLQALKENPDIIVWPEGAFNADLVFDSDLDIVQELKSFVIENKINLITGVIDVDEQKLEKQKQLELENPSLKKYIPGYNSVALVSQDGELAGIYNKIHLVPFTEHFPYEKELPWMYKFLKEFDINWWEKGSDMKIFEHPQFRFFTPICFEDVFPGEISKFVLKDADVIVNLSNDFWSMSPVEGKQHAVTALFRAVENRRPLVRSTTSGLTCYVDNTGRIRQQSPYFKPAWFIADIPLLEKKITFYTRTGDWFPFTAMGALVLLFILSFVPWFKKE